MTTQAMPDFNAELQRQIKATKNAQDLADQYKAQLDALRSAVHGNGDERARGVATLVDILVKTEQAEKKRKDTAAQHLRNEEYYRGERDEQRARADAAIATQRALCDVLSADSETIAGQTLVEAVRALITARDTLERQLGEAHATIATTRQWARAWKEAASRRRYWHLVCKNTLAASEQRYQELLGKAMYWQGRATAAQPCLCCAVAGCAQPGCGCGKDSVE